MAGRKPKKPQRFLKRREPLSPPTSGDLPRHAAHHISGDTLRATNLDLLLQAGLDAHRAGNFAEAKRQYELVATARPDDHRTRQLLGIVLHQLGDHSAAERLLREAIAMAGHVPEYHANLGAILLNLHRHRDALDCLEQAKRLGPIQFETLLNMAQACRRLNMSDRTSELLNEALRIRPDSTEAVNELGMLKYTQQKLDEAADCFQRILAHHPQHTDALNNLGIVTQCRGNVVDAMALYDRAIAAKPTFAEAFNQKAMAYRELSQVPEALACYRRALELKPDFHSARNAYVYLLNYDPSISRQTLLEEHLRWASLCAQLTPFPSAVRNLDTDRPLKIGYVSPDFRRHAVARYIEPVLELHDRARCQITCYAEVAREDAVTQRLRNLPVTWRSTCGVSDRDVAAQIRADEIDLLIDLAGHTANSRLRVFAYRPAPVQISYLGYPATTGLAAIEYYLTDPLLTPMEDQRYFVEELIPLQRVCCFRPPVNAPPVAELPANRAGHVTFGSLHRPEKLSAATLDLWAQVLQSAPQSRLLLFWSTMPDQVRNRLFEQLESRGIARDRIEIRNQCGPEGYLPVYHEIDIGLDVLPWNGATTTLEALWMGVVVLGLAGDRSLSRGTESILKHLELPELVAESPDAYVELARSLAFQPARLAALRRGMRDRIQATWADAIGFIENLEQTYRQLWQRYVKRTSASNDPLLHHRPATDTDV
jgi:predicted O-linked N-acetylglucosamine transferase (SPINDLY family)